jgi:membrane protease YdiL (CAAX protease family)
LLQPETEPPAVAPDPSDAAQRLVALTEVVLCSDFVTQIAVGGALAALGVAPYVKGTTRLSVSYVVALSLGDAALLIGLMLIILRAHGQSPRRIFLGKRPVIGEALLGVPLTFMAFGIAAAVLLSVLRFAPSLHTVADNPLQSMLTTPRDAWLFALVLVVAGGVREEMQRAFLLDRFERWLGGARLGVLIISIGFGAGHLTQGVDATIATGLLGAFWAVIYLWRRSCVAPMVSHTAFDLLQILQFLVRR